MNQTNRVLILAGSAIIGSAYTPAPKPQPSPEAIERYITTHTARYKYSPYLNHNDWKRSEERKRELLADIRSIRQQIRKQALNMHKYKDVDSYDQFMRIKEARLDKHSEHVVIEVAGRMHTRTCQKIYQVMTQRAEEIKVPRKYLSEEKILKRKNILVVDMTTV